MHAILPLGEHLIAFVFVLTVFTFGFSQPGFHVFVYLVNVPHTLGTMRRVFRRNFLCFRRSLLLWGRLPTRVNVSLALSLLACCR